MTKLSDLKTILEGMLREGERRELDNVRSLHLKFERIFPVRTNPKLLQYDNIHQSLWMAVLHPGMYDRYMEHAKKELAELNRD